jgi:para-nitrobenzyl esterase
MKSTLSALLSAALIASTGVAHAGSMISISADPITTNSGQVSGTLLPSGVRAYLGVPFAQPPTQSLRWRPPEPIHWDGVWTADKKGPECIQVLRPHNINHYFGEEATSEDCLYMNMWAPPKATPQSALPVVVFIYGGGFTIGSSGMANYDGEALAQHGAVFVNFNYRVGMLGFMAHPELSAEQGGHSGNYGFLDQNAALKWVHENIAQFGGDPSKVVIMGQSAGAFSVAAQLFSPLSRGLFRGAVMSSACTYAVSGAPLEQAEQIGLDVQRRLGAANLDEMRLVPADKILAVQAEGQVGAHVAGVRTVTDIDGYFMPTTKLAQLQAHAMNDVPIIVGSNREDLDAASLVARPKTLQEYREMASTLFGGDAPAFLARFPVATDAELRQVALRAARDLGLVADNRQCAELQTKYNHSPTYVDLFTRVQPYAPNVKIADVDPATAGAYHTADIPYWFGNLDKYNMFRHTRDWSTWDRTLSDRMMQSLIAFAETGNPSTDAFAWPAWAPAKEQMVDFGDTIRVVPMDVTDMDWLAAHRPASVRDPFGDLDDNSIHAVNAGPRD